MTKLNDDARSETSGIIKIIGIGQSLRGDDAAGLAAVRMWQETYQAQAQRPHIHVELSEIPGISLLNLLEGSSLAILVDAVRSGARPGTLHQLSEEQLDAFTTGAGSAHGWGVAETLAMGHVLMPESMPQKLILIGIEAGDISPGGSFSSSVEQALPQAARLIEELVPNS